MRPGHVFVSYSRRQFHAARQLAIVLSEQGLDTWFDVERLVPGTDWSATIDRAVDEAAALVVVASADAIASAYVTEEWRRAMARGIPVYVATVRGSRLPADLAACPRADLRGRFEPAAAGLAAAIQGGSGLKAPRRWALWPASVLLVAAALALNALAAAGLLVVAALDLDYPIPDHHRAAAAAMAVSGLIYAGWLLQPLLGFAGGRARLIEIRLPLYGAVPLLFIVWGVFGSLISAVNHGVSFINEASISGDRTGPYVLVLAPLLLVDVAALRVLGRSAAVLRMLPAGEGPRRSRAKLDARRRPVAPGPATPISTIAVHHAEADSVIAEQLAAAFRSAGARVDSTDPDLRLVVVSNATTWDEVAAPLRRGRAVAVLACSVHLPAEAEDLRRIQWLDFRDGQFDPVRDFAASLTHPSPAHPSPADPSSPAESASLTDSAPPVNPVSPAHPVVRVRAAPVPRAVDAFDAPRPTKIVLECLVAAATVFALSAVLTATLAPPSEDRVHTNEFPMVANPPPIPARTTWHPLLECGPGLVPASPRALPPSAGVPPASPRVPPKSARAPTTAPRALRTPTGGLPNFPGPLPTFSWPGPTFPGALPLPTCRIVVPTPEATSPRPLAIENPKYPALPESADFVLRVRAWLAAALALLALALAVRLERRALRRDVFEAGMLALFVLSGVWALLGVAEVKQRLLWYAAVWIVAAVGLTRHASTITEWLPGTRRPRHHLRAVPAGLLRPTLPTALLLLGVWYAGGVVL